MKGLYTNRNSKQDFVQNGFYEFVREGMDIFIASAFFTELDVIDMFLDQGCHIRIVVRLGFPTSPKALEKLLGNDSVEARFYTSHSFHPKLYIFGDEAMFLGSANLTRSAILTNQEIMLSLAPNDPRFDELTHLFSEYWAAAEVLNERAIASYKLIYEKFKDVSRKIDEFNEEVLTELGESSFPNIGRPVKKETRKSIFLDAFRKSYQESVAAFRKIENVYASKPRKVPAERIPIRTEIDSFFGFIREEYAVEGVWEQQSVGWNASSRLLLEDKVAEWLETDWPHFEERIVNENYPLINSTFGSKESIASASATDIMDALCVLHSFHDRLRYFKGGLETLKSEFLRLNSLEKIKATLTYLLHGEGEVVSRMADCLYDDYKLNNFGQSNVQELVGWINNENLPVVNGRTTKVLRYFGFDVRQL